MPARVDDSVSIRPIGAAVEWNQKYPEEQMLVHDVILQVNGKTDNDKKIKVVQTDTSFVIRIMRNIANSPDTSFAMPKKTIESIVVK